MVDAPWRLQLVPASYNGTPFYVEVQSRSGGFRLVSHEFPKKDIPWTENMGRRVRHWPVTAYLVYSPVNMPDVFGSRDLLIAALETPGGGILVLPTGLQNMSDEPPGAVTVDTWTVVERQERGGWCAFEIVFVESGQTISTLPFADTASTTTTAATQLQTAATNSTDMGYPAAGLAGANPVPAFGAPALGIGAGNFGNFFPGQGITTQTGETGGTGSST